MDALENWFDLRSQLIWAYDGPVTEFSSCEYPATPIAAWFLHKGSVTIRFGSRKNFYKEGIWIFPQGEEGWQEFSEDAEILSVRFFAEWPTGRPLFDRSRTLTLDAKNGHDLLRVGRRMAKFAQRKYPGIKFELRQMSGSPESYFELHRLFYAWMKAYTIAMQGLGLAPYRIGQTDERVQTMIHLMETQSLNLPLREQYLAKKTNLSISQVNRLFVRQIGKTPKEYWEAKRITAAKRALAESTQSIKSIAYDLGFSSLPHFSHWIQKRFNQSPKQLRAISQERPY